MRGIIFLLKFLFIFNVSTGLHANNDSFTYGESEPSGFSMGKGFAGGRCYFGEVSVGNSGELFTCKGSVWAKSEASELSGSVCGLSHTQAGWAVTGDVLAYCKGYNARTGCPSGYSRVSVSDHSVMNRSESGAEYGAGYYYYHCVKN